MSSELSAKQTQAALLLARGDTVTTTAEQVGVNRMTIHQWLKEDDNFNAYLIVVMIFKMYECGFYRRV